MVILNLLTFGLWGKLGRVAHYAVDAVLLSTIIAGIRRSSGLTLKADKISESKQFSEYFDMYLGAGEWVMDKGVAFALTSNYFHRSR